MNSLEIIVRMNKRKLIENYIAKILYRLPLEMQLEMIEFQVLNDLQYMGIQTLLKLSICNLTEKWVAWQNLKHCRVSSDICRLVNPITNLFIFKLFNL